MAGKGIIRIYYKDSSYKSFYLHEDATAKEVAELFGSDFLHVEKKVSAHFSIHVVIDGKDIRQLKPDDRPLKVQRDLFSLKISWNTDKNYFLFCLSDEAKMRMTAKLGSPPPEVGNPQKLRGGENDLIMPNKLGSQSNVDRRPLSRKLTSLRPKLLFGKGGKSEIRSTNRPPLSSSLSESSDLGIPKQLTPVSPERRSMTVGGTPANEPLSSKTKQEISENLRKMIMEEKQKLQLPPNNNTKTSSPSPSSVISPEAESVLHNFVQSTYKKDEEDNKKIAQQQKGIEETQNSIAGVQNLQAFKTVVPNSPATAKRENEEISNMFDSIFDWYPTKSDSTSDTSSESTNHYESPPALPPSIDEPDEEFDSAFDDILGVLDKLRA